MIELGELEAHHREFDKRNTRVVVASLENQETARLTQSDFPHLLVVADAERKLTDALAVMDQRPAPNGKDMAAPTTILLDPTGTVRWIFRAGSVLRRLSPAEVLAAVHEKIPGR